MHVQARAITANAAPVPDRLRNRGARGGRRAVLGWLRGLQRWFGLEDNSRWGATELPLIQPGMRHTRSDGALAACWNPPTPPRLRSLRAHPLWGNHCHPRPIPRSCLALSGSGLPGSSYRSSSDTEITSVPGSAAAVLRQSRDELTRGVGAAGVLSTQRQQS